MVETASSTEEIVEGSAKLGVPKMKSPKGRHKIFKQTTKKKTKEPSSLKLEKWKNNQEGCHENQFFGHYLEIYSFIALWVVSFGCLRVSCLNASKMYFLCSNWLML